MRLEHPCRRELRGAKKSGLVGIVADNANLGVDFVGLASSPTRLPAKPPPITMRDASFQPLSLRKRRSTTASSCANDSMAL
jgi:hypothetical protein